MIKSIHEHVSEATNSAFQFAMPYTIAILTVDSNKVPIFLGSGFFIEFEGKVFCITASHVLDGMSDGLYVAKQGFYPIIGKAIRTPRKNDRDDLDIAYWQVDKDLPNNIQAQVIQENSIFKNREFENQFYCASGYPSSKHKIGKAIHISNKQITSYCHLFSAIQAVVNFEDYGKNNNLHIALKYSNMFTEDGKKTNPISLQGMSGGPLWLAKDSFTTNNLFLAGMLIEFYEKKGKVVFFTKIQVVYDFIKYTT